MKNKLTIIRASALLLFMVFAFNTISAQNTGISNTAINQDSSKKEIKSANSSKTVMRVALTGRTDNITIKGTSTNLLIYNTATAGSGQDRVYPGYYHNIGTSALPDWKRVEVTVSDAVKDKK